MPHMIDRDVVAAMQARCECICYVSMVLIDSFLHHIAGPEQFDATYSHQFRHPNDMQFAFSHYYFLMSQRRDFNIESIWENELDLY